MRKGEPGEWEREREREREREKGVLYHQYMLTAVSVGPSSERGRIPTAGVSVCVCVCVCEGELGVEPWPRAQDSEKAVWWLEIPQTLSVCKTKENNKPKFDKNSNINNHHRRRCCVLFFSFFYTWFLVKFQTPACVLNKCGSRTKSRKIRKIFCDPSNTIIKIKLYIFLSFLWLISQFHLFYVYNIYVDIILLWYVSPVKLCGNNWTFLFCFACLQIYDVMLGLCRSAKNITKNKYYI